MSVILETTIGDITVDLFTKERPTTCLNFLKLCKIKYYNLCLFHKVERNFIAQSGDPSATGRGGESIFAKLYGDQAKYFEAELKPRLKHEKLGTLSMVNNGNNMNGSQFFITLGENITYLDEVHTIFGEVVEGIETLIKFNDIICDKNDRPYQDIRITHTVILHDPYDDPPGLEIPDSSPEPTREMLETDYIAPDEDIDDTKGKSIEEIEEKIKDSEAKARATILEMVGDIPDADVKPPENVLFVCKLNPVTTSEDLELIFSRFGHIVSCEVIKDKKSGESLQYAFIEFEKEEDCENAYFKMDNVLIDDRRIHVDFSQSVSKMNWNKQYNSFIKGKSQKSQNWAIKDREKKSDGYEMIFDNDSDHSGKRQKNEGKTSHSKRPYYSSRESGHKIRESNFPNKEKNHDSRNHNYESTQNYSSRAKSPKKSYDRSESHNSRSKYKTYSSSTSNKTSYNPKTKKSTRHDSSSSDSSVSLSRNRNISKNREDSYKSFTSLNKPHSSDRYSRTSKHPYEKKYAHHNRSSSNSPESLVRQKRTYNSEVARSKDSYMKEDSSGKERKIYSSPSRHSKHISSKKIYRSQSRSTSPVYKRKKSISSNSDSGSESTENCSSKKISKSVKNYKKMSKSESRKLYKRSRFPQDSEYRKKKSSKSHAHKNSKRHEKNITESSSDSSDSDSDSYKSKKKSKSIKSRHDRSKQRTRD